MHLSLFPTHLYLYLSLSCFPRTNRFHFSLIPLPGAKVTVNLP
jgi:hypothetical protein